MLNAALSETKPKVKALSTGANVGAVGAAPKPKGQKVTGPSGREYVWDGTPKDEERILKEEKMHTGSKEAFAGSEAKSSQPVNAGVGRVGTARPIRQAAPNSPTWNVNSSPNEIITRSQGSKEKMRSSLEQAVPALNAPGNLIQSLLEKVGNLRSPLNVPIPKLTDLIAQPASLLPHLANTPSMMAAPTTPVSRPPSAVDPGDFLASGRILTHPDSTLLQRLLAGGEVYTDIGMPGIGKVLGPLGKALGVLPKEPLPLVPEPIIPPPVQDIAPVITRKPPAALPARSSVPDVVSMGKQTLKDIEASQGGLMKRATAEAKLQKAARGRSEVEPVPVAGGQQVKVSTTSTGKTSLLSAEERQAIYKKRDQIDVLDNFIKTHEHVTDPKMQEAVALARKTRESSPYATATKPGDVGKQLEKAVAKIQKQQAKPKLSVVEGGPAKPAEPVAKPVVKSTRPVDTSPVTINYVRNPQKAPNMGSRFGQDIEPAGQYVVHQHKDHVPDGWIAGQVTFNKPLVIDFGGGYGDATNWKAVLSKRYGGKTGEELSAALRRDGYDGIVTREGEGYSEIINLKAERADLPAKPTPKVETPSPVTPKVGEGVKGEPDWYKTIKAKNKEAVVAWYEDGKVVLHPEDAQLGVELGGTKRADGFVEFPDRSQGVLIERVTGQGRKIGIVDPGKPTPVHSPKPTEAVKVPTVPVKNGGGLPRGRNGARSGALYIPFDEIQAGVKAGADTVEKLRAHLKAKGYADWEINDPSTFKDLAKAKAGVTAETVKATTPTSSTPRGPMSDDARAQRRIKAIQKQIEDLKSGKKGVRLPHITNPQIEQLVKERDALRQSLKPPPVVKASEILTDVMNVPRTLQATGDISATGRQGMFHLITHPGKSLKANARALKALVDPKYSEALDTALKAAPEHAMRQKSGLYLADAHGPLSVREEGFMSNLVKKIPGVKPIVEASERHYNTVLNEVRASVFDDFVKKHPGLPQAEYDRYAKFVNSATGRGSLPGRADEMLTHLSGVFYSPRFAISRFQTPAMAIKAATNLKSPAARQIAGDAAKFVATVYGSLKLAEAGGAKVDWDPKSTNFLKVQAGKTSYDVLAGFSQPIRMVYRAAVGKMVDSKGTTRNTSPSDQVGQFLTGKMAPGPKIGYQILTGKDIMFNKPKSKEQTAWEALTPLVVQEFERMIRGGESPAKGIPIPFGVNTDVKGAVMSDRYPVRR